MSSKAGTPRPRDFRINRFKMEPPLNTTRRFGPKHGSRYRMDGGVPMTALETKKQMPSNENEFFICDMAFEARATCRVVP